MNSAGNKRLLNGAVEEALSGGLFRVRLDEGGTALAHLSGKVRINHIRILMGDRVIVEFGPYDTSRGRIVKRL